MQLERTKELNKYPTQEVSPRRCIHTLSDGSQCRAIARKESTRCRHHQLDQRKHGRVARSLVNIEVANDYLVASKAHDLMAAPFNESAEQIRRWEELGIVDRGRAKMLRYALQLNAIVKRERDQMRDNQGFGGSGKGI